MNVDPGAINYQQGLGGAVILPTFNNSGLWKVAATEQQKQQDQATAKAAEDKAINDLLTKDIDPPARRDVEAVRGQIGEMETYISDQLAQESRDFTKAGTPEWRELQELQRKTTWGAKKSQEDEAWLTETVKQIKSSSDPYLDKEEAMRQVLRYYYGTDGKKNVFTEDYGERPNWQGAFNEGAWVKDFVDGLPEKVSEQFEIGSDGQGTLIVSEEVKGKFFDLDKNGDIKTDSKGKPIINVGPEFTEMAMQDSRFRSHVEREMADPSNAGKTAQQIVEEKLRSHGQLNIKSSAKGGHRYPSKSGSGKNKTSSEDNVLTEMSKLLQHDFGKLKTGTDESVTLPDGTQKILRKVPSLFDLKKMGTNELGDKVTIDGIYIDPGQKEGFFIQDSDGNVQEFDSSNAYDLLSVLTENTGEYNRTQIDRILGEKDGYQNGVFQPNKFYKSDVGDKQTVVEQESGYQQLVQIKQDKAIEILDQLEDTGAFEWIGNKVFGWAGVENLNQKFAVRLEKEVLNDVGLIIDGKKYPNLGIEVSSSGAFTLKNKDNGEVIEESLSEDQLKTLFRTSKIIPKRAYLDGEQAKAAKKEESEDEQENKKSAEQEENNKGINYGELIY